MKYLRIKVPGMKKIWRWKTRELHPCHFNPKNIIRIFFQSFAFSLLDLLHHRHFHPFLFILLYPQIFQFCEYLLVHILNKIWSSVMLWRAFLVFMAWLGCTFVSPPLLATIIQHSTTYFVGWKLWLTWIQWLFIFYWTRIYWKFEWLNVNLIDNFLMCAN